MDERLKAFLDELNIQLAGLPELEKLEVMDYYQEYIDDALEEGLSPEELLSRLDTPVKIAAVVKAEASIRNARTNPGLKNYSKAVKYARFNITRPLAVFMFSILIFISYSIAIPLFLVTVSAAAAACLILPFFIYEALRIPFQYTAEIAGTIGIGIFCSGLMLLLAYGFFILSRFMLRLSTGLISLMMKKEDRSMPDIPENKTVKRRASRLLLSSGLMIITAGLVIALASGLPVKLFTLFNSMKPGNITVQNWEYDADKAKRLSITTAHSNIRLEEGTSDRIEIRYEKSDWLEPEISLKNSQLVFTEKSNGRMPLFSLVTMHENRAELVVTLPGGYKTDEVKLDSRGGFIHVDTMRNSVSVRTYTGSIYLDATRFEEAEVSAAIRAKTFSGEILSEDRAIGTKTSNSTTYEASGGNGAIIQMETDRGSIYID